jgi:hypothetical protein
VTWTNLKLLLCLLPSYLLINLTCIPNLMKKVTNNALFFLVVNVAFTWLLGIPTHDKDGKELSKSAAKGIKKDYDKQV